MPGGASGNNRHALVARLLKHVGHTLLVTIRCGLAGEREYIATCVGSEHLCGRLRTEPRAAICNAQTVGPPLEFFVQDAAANVLETPVQPGRKPSQRIQKVVMALFLHAAANRQDDDRICRIGTVATALANWRQRQVRQAQAMIDELDPRRVGNQVLETGEFDFRAGDQPIGLGEFPRNSHS